MVEGEVKGNLKPSEGTEIHSIHDLSSLIFSFGSDFLKNNLSDVYNFSQSTLK